MWIEKVCFEVVGKRNGWEEEFTKAAIVAANSWDNATLAADLIFAFFLE